MSDNRSVLLTIEGRSFDGIDLDGLASGNHLLRVDLGELADLAAVIDSAADRSDIFYVGTGNLDFDARAAAAIGVPLLITYDRSGPHVERAIRQATDLGAVVAEACDGHRLAWAVGPALEVEAPQVMSQAVFEHRLLNKAKRIGAHIVLPEGEDSRILRAAHRLLADDLRLHRSVRQSLRARGHGESGRDGEGGGGEERGNSCCDRHTSTVAPLRSRKAQRQDTIQ